jgi:dihydrodipicolinate synthase/N-acetylneuraminate lyase
VLLYHIPQVTGIAISDRLLDLIGDHDNLAGVKDSSDSPNELERLGRRFASRSYFVGSDRLISACRDVGGAGSISAAANVAPSLVAAVHRGGADQPALDAVRALLESYGLGPGVKAILRRAGVGDYATRPPLLELDSEREEALWEAYCTLVPVADRPTSRLNVER